MALEVEHIVDGGLQIPQNADTLGCPMCGHEAVYQPDEMHIRQAHGGGFSV